MNNRKIGRSCGNYRPFNNFINGEAFEFNEQNVTVHDCSDCVYFSSKNCGKNISSTWDEYNKFY